tara:strand:+ start:140 stop:661 length:522 start_codon:yes stop_codon:yes gene_type:complete
MKIKKKFKVAILDRDGVLNFAKKNNGYIGFKKDFKWIPGAKKTIKYLNDNNYKVAVVTNQSGVARKFFKFRDVIRLHQFMNIELKKISAKIDKFYFCPHHEDALDNNFRMKCICRKPNNGNFLKLKKKWNLELKNCFMVGDQKTDILFAKKSKIKGYLFKGGNLFSFVKKKIK